MAKKKSAAQLKRLQKRAEARGEVYELPTTTTDAVATQSEGDSTSVVATAAQTSEPSKSHSKDIKRCKQLVKLARSLQEELQKIEKDTTLKSKDRRSAKRKAEAITSEKLAGVDTEITSTKELLEWYESYADSKEGQDDENDDDNVSPHKEKGKAKKDASQSHRRNPYILFFGQLSYGTSKERLLEHITAELGEEFPDLKSKAKDLVKIRLLTDPKNPQRSRGMAFVECDNPELLYGCLKLHHSFLDGRRINVERTAGGSRNSQQRTSKLDQYRREQFEYMEQTITGVIDEYKQRGDIGENELDEGVMLLLKRHSATVVQGSLQRYVETNGRDMDNPSAYLTYLIGKIAEEGVFTDENKGKKQHSGSTKSEPKHRVSNDRPRKRQKHDEGREFGSGLAKHGDIDMSISKPRPGDLAAIFPSYKRGRGRG